MTKNVPLGQRLRYPITVRKLLKHSGDKISKREVLFQYTYVTKKESGDIVRDAIITEHTAYADWESPVEGKLKHWRIREGAVLNGDQPAFEVEEECGHEVQFNGLCALCGKDLTEIDFSQERADTERATISMIHDQNSLKVSADLAQAEEKRMQTRLLEQRKLVLVVDLDQTIIHACIDPTVGEWLADSSNPNYESLKDIGKFQLDDSPSQSLSGCWYYIKKRPGLDGFLERMSKLFEMHVYTMGTRPYAVNVAKVVDPDKKLFSNRVISRDETGSLRKDLQRLFPHSTDMVMIIDDRSDVWPNDRENLIRVAPFDFFKGIGDINSSFLPQRTDILPTTNSDDTTTLDTATTQEDPDSIQAASEQEKELEKQLEDRPLLHMQQDLEKNDSKMEGVESTDASAEANSDADADLQAHAAARQHVLRDDDTELVYIERHLKTIHENFYRAYDEQQRASGRRSSKIMLDAVPDVGELLRIEKRRVLEGTHIVLSGLVNLNLNVHETELGMQLVSFGATIHTKVTDKVTHLVVNPHRLRTQKLRQACRIPKIQIVNPDWLTACFSEWEHVDEYPFLISVSAADWDEPGEKSNGDASGKDTKGDQDIKMAEAVEGNGNGPENDNDASGASGDEDEADGPDNAPGGTQQTDGGEKQALENLVDFDWAAVDDELAEFLNSDADDDEGEDGDIDDSDTERIPTTSLSLKRKADEAHTDTDAEGDTDTEMPGGANGSAQSNGSSGAATGTAGALGAEHPMFKRLRLGVPRKSSALRNVTSSEVGAGAGTGTGTVDSPASVRSMSADPAASTTTQDLEDDLEAALAAELEAELAQAD